MQYTVIGVGYKNFDSISDKASAILSALTVKQASGVNRVQIWGLLNLEKKPPRNQNLLSPRKL